MPTEVVIPMVVTMEVITAVPATEPVACRKIEMKGYPVLELKASLISPKQKSIASSIPKPREPLIKTLSIMEVGTAIEALVISSDI